MTRYDASPGVAALCSAGQPQAGHDREKPGAAHRPASAWPVRRRAPSTGAAPSYGSPVGSASSPVHASCPATSAHASTPRGAGTASIGLV